MRHLREMKCGMEHVMAAEHDAAHLHGACARRLQLAHSRGQQGPGGLHKLVEQEGVDLQMYVWMWKGHGSGRLPPHRDGATLAQCKPKAVGPETSTTLLTPPNRIHPPNQAPP